MSAFFSGDPLPIAPRLQDGEGESLKQNFVELERFNDKLLEYLRRLGLHLSNPDVVTEPSSSVQSCAVRLTVDTAFSGSPLNLKWDKNIRVDSAFEHDETTDPELITLVSGGFHIALIQVGTGSSQDVFSLDIDGTTIPWSNHHTVIEISYFLMVPFHALAGAKIKLESDGATTAVVAETSMTVLKLGGLSPVSGEGGGDCDDEPWLICP